MTCPPRAHTGCTPPAALAAGSDRSRWCRTRLRLTAPSVGLGFAAGARRGAGDRVQRSPRVRAVQPCRPTVAGARACGAEHDHDSGVDCVQIAAAVHDTVNCDMNADGNGGAVPPTHSASGALPSFPSFNMSSSPRSRPSEAMSGLARRAHGRGQACPARKGAGDAPRPLDYVPASQTLSRH